MRKLALVFSALAVPVCCAAQSINVDFGDPASKPQATYAARGLAGYWNSVGALPEYQRLALTQVNGSPSGINIYMAGGDAILAVDDPTTTANDAALLDDMLIGDNNPTDVCIWFEHVAAGDYEVILYAMTPGDAAHQNRLRVDSGSPGPMMCGGAWAGFHQDGVTFVRFHVFTSNGYIGLHSGLYGGILLSGLNGVQLRANPPTDAPAQTNATPQPWVRVYPNPGRGDQLIEFTVEPGRDRAGIFDVAGRLVRSLPAGLTGSGPFHVVWDGRDSQARPVPAAVYYVRMMSGGASAAAPAPVARIVRR